MSGAKQRKQFKELLESLRQELRVAKPIYFASFSGELSRDTEVVRLLASGFLSAGDMYTSWTFENSTTILFGNETSFASSFDGFRKIAPRINESIRAQIRRKPSDEPLHSVDHFTEDQHALLACEMMWIYVRGMWSAQPESLLLPQSVIVEVVYQTGNSPGLLLPNGDIIDPRNYFSPTWNEKRQLLLEKKTEMRLVQTPLLQTAALIARDQMGETVGGVGETAIKKREKAIRKLSDLQRAALEIIKKTPVGKTISGKQIVEQLGKEHGLITSEPTVTSHIIPKLKRLGVRSRKRGGYWVDESAPR